MRPNVHGIHRMLHLHPHWFTITLMSEVKIKDFFMCEHKKMPWVKTMMPRLSKHTGKFNKKHSATKIHLYLTQSPNLYEVQKKNVDAK